MIAIPKTWSEAKSRGEKHYFTGNPCKRGHVSKRLASSGSCCECVKSSSLSYYHRNRHERIEKARKWREENRDYCLEYSKKYYRLNGDYFTEYASEYQRKNSKRLAEYSKDYARKNPLVVRANNAKRRASCKDGASGKDVSDWCEAQAKVCFYCQIECEDCYHIDHYFPLSKGGLHEIENLRISCPDCNMSKGSKLPEDWRKIKGQGEK